MEEQLLIEWNELATKVDDLKYILLKHSNSLGEIVGSIQKEYHETNKKLDTLESMMEATGKFWFRDYDSPLLKS